MRSPALAALVSALAVSGCVTLTPFTEVRTKLPAESFVTIGGQQVHVEHDGSGEPVVLIHGFGGSSYSWRHLVPTLATRYEVVAPDLNGFGWTERPSEPEAYTLEGQPALVLGVLDALGIASAHVVGHSYGGGLALWLAARHPERVRSLVLVDSTLPTYSVARRKRVARFRPFVSLALRSVLLRHSFVRRGLMRSVADPELVTEELVEAYAERLRVEGAVDAYQGLTAPVSGPQPRVDLAEIRQPTLVVWGADDRLLDARVGEEAARMIPAARFLLLARCGHLPMEEQPEELARAVLDFLAALPR